MAKTLKFNVSFAITIGASTDVEKGFEEIREELREEVRKEGLDVVRARAAGSLNVFDAMLSEDVSAEDCFIVCVKSGIRTMLEGHRENDKEGNFQRIGNISVKVA